MKRTGYYLWLIPDKLTGKPRRTRYRMTVEEAQERYPGAVSVEGSVQWHDLPETDAERIERDQSLHTALTKGRQGT
jgi:hypothetical protein